MSQFRIAFLGTPDFAATPLKTLIEDEHFKIVKVVTQPDRPAGRGLQVKPCPVKEIAVAHGLDVISPENVNDPDVLEELKGCGASAAVVVAFGQILSNDFLKLFPLGSVNVHASLLPRWRGAAPIQRAIMAGDSESGVSLQIVVQQLDAGPVLGIRKVPLTEDMDAVKLYSTLKSLGGDLLKIDFVDFLRGNLTPVPQDESKKTIARKIQKSEGEINWTKPAREIFNYMLGLRIWPGIWTYRHGKMLKIIEAKVAPDWQGPPGKILDVTAETFIVGCGDQALEIWSVQPESRSVQIVSEYLKGYAMKVGEVLGEKFRETPSRGKN